MRSSPGNLRKGEEVMVVVSVMYMVCFSLAGGVAASVSLGTGVLIQARSVMAASSPALKIGMPRDLVSMLIALLSGVYGPTRVLLPFLVVTLVLTLYRFIVMALYVTVLLSVFVR